MSIPGSLHLISLIVFSNSIASIEWLYWLIQYAFQNAVCDNSIRFIVVLIVVEVFLSSLFFIILYWHRSGSWWQHIKLMSLDVLPQWCPRVLLAFKGPLGGIIPPVLLQCLFDRNTLKRKHVSHIHLFPSVRKVLLHCLKEYNIKYLPK